MTVEPSLVPVFGMTRQDYEGEDSALPTLNGDASKLQAKAVGALVLQVQVKIFSKQFHGQLFLKVHFTEYLEVADVRYGIGPDVLRVKFEKMEDISKEL